jgi:hypothetical protein
MPRIALIAALAFLASPALAQGTPQAPPPKPKPLTQLFISPMGEPFRAAKGDPYPSAAWFKQADRGDKGYVTLDDFKADAERFFKVLDKDGDGVLDESEINVYETRVAPEVNTNVTEASNMGDPNKIDWEQYRNADGSPAEVRVDGASLVGGDHDNDWKRARNMIASRRGAGIFGFIDEPEPVRAADTNIDFRITFKEWMAAATKRFGMLDFKHDGKLTLETLPKTPFQLLMGSKKR